MRILQIGDLHFGEKGNSTKWNRQLLTFLRWAVDLAKEQNVELIIQAGDWYHNRHLINVETLNYGVDGAEILAESGIETVVLEGNHDLYFLDRLDVTSLRTLRKYVRIIDEPTQLNEHITAVPWIADGDVWQQCINATTPHLIGHFEFNGFKVNDGYEMEKGLSHRELAKFVTVSSGHYHSHQEKDNVKYLGTPLPITMNEANEPHGVFILDTDTNEHEFFEYDAVKVLSIPFINLESELAGCDPQNTTIRIEFPTNLEDETLISDTVEKYSKLGFAVQYSYESTKQKELLLAVEDDTMEVEDINSVVYHHLSDLVVDGMDNDLLLELFNESTELLQKGGNDNGL